MLTSQFPFLMLYFPPSPDGSQECIMRAIESFLSFAGCLPPLLWNFRTPPFLLSTRAMLTSQFPFSCPTSPISDGSQECIMRAIESLLSFAGCLPPLLWISGRPLPAVDKSNAHVTVSFFFMLYFLHLGWIPGKYHKSDRKSHSVLSSKRPSTHIIVEIPDDLSCWPPLSANDVSKLTSYS